MHTDDKYRELQIRCALLRNLRSALLAVACVTLPRTIDFLQRGQFNRAAAWELLQTILVAALMVLFNYLQHLRFQSDNQRLRRRAALRRKQ